jgi:polar amino acid transport system substrate-binding protein
MFTALTLPLAGSAVRAAWVTSIAETISGFRKKGELVVGMSGDQPPLNVTARDGRIIGLEADISSRLASDMGVKLRVATMPFAELLRALSEGKIDLILSGMTMPGK